MRLLKTAIAMASIFGLAMPCAFALANGGGGSTGSGSGTKGHGHGAHAAHYTPILTPIYCDITGTDNQYSLDGGFSHFVSRNHALALNFGFSTGLGLENSEGGVWTGGSYDNASGIPFKSLKFAMGGFNPSNSDPLCLLSFVDAVSGVTCYAIASSEGSAVSALKNGDYEATFNLQNMVSMCGQSDQNLPVVPANNTLTSLQIGTISSPTNFFVYDSRVNGTAVTPNPIPNGPRLDCSLYAELVDGTLTN